MGFVNLHKYLLIVFRKKNTNVSNYRHVPFLFYRMFIERRIMIGLEIDKNMAWNTIPKQHSKQHDGSSCGVYVLTVYSCTSLNKYLIFHHIKKKK